MDVAASQPPSHHGTAAPTRSSPPKPATPRQVVGTTRASRSNNNNSNGGKAPLAATATTRKKGAATIAAVAAEAAAAAAAAAGAALGVGGGNGGGGGGGGGGSAVPGGGGGAVKKRDSAKKGGAESPRGARGGGSGVNGGSGSGSGSGNTSGVSRKRVRVRDEKLGEFAVLLAPYEGDHNDICEICDKGGDLLCCDFCNLVYHLCCVTPKLTELPDEDLWMCPACTTEVTSRQIAKRRRMEDGGRSTSPGPGGSGRHHGQERVRGYQGVKAENDAFRAFVLYKNQTMDIGLFPTAQAAARAYDRKALSLFGDAAVCNFPADEQVEVEGVATDGTTVKGVVRSFHQWRAEMQWGNKKRHLGFFERLEHASQAYNRAALYMNGPETPLNPTKEGFMPPPLTGRSVRVPRNKLFVQQLPLPLIAQAQVEEANNSAEFVRRRQQMRGKYHSPLVGDNHQVSRLPPLPPPSRPRASRIRYVAGAAAAAAAPSSAGEAAMSLLGATEAAAPGGLKSESRVKDGGTACVDLPEALRVEVSSKLVISQAVAAPAAAAAALPAVVGNVTYSPVASAVSSQAVAGKGKGRDTAAANDPVGCPLARKPPPPTAVVASCAESRLKAGAAADTAATTMSAVVGAASLSAGVAKPPAAAADDVSKPPAACVTATASTSPPRGLTKAVNSPGDGPVLVNRGGEMMMIDWERPSRSQLADSMEVDNRSGLGEAAAKTVASAATSPPADLSQIKADDGSVVITAGTTTTVGEASLKVLYPAAAAAVAAEASRSQILTGDCETSTLGQTKPTEAQASVAPPSTPRRASAESEGGGGSRSADYRPVTGWERTTLVRAPSPPAPSPPRSSLPVKGTPILASSGATRGQAGVGAAETVSLAMKPLRSAVASATPASSSVTSPARSPSPNAAGRKRRLGAGGGCSAGGRGNGVTGSGASSRSSSSGSGSSSGRKGGTGALPPPPPPLPPPIPDLSFEDVAELVWDPRSGPKPRGAAEARGPRGAAAANRSPLKQAMWDRDSALLERVAPAHAEKSMQVLQMHRHDVERAAQMLTVRHGIHVVGLSSVRTTRNKRAEQQQQQQQQQSLLNPATRPPSSSFGGGGSNGSSGGGGGGGGRSNGRASFEGWQAAAAPRAPPAAKTVGTASPTHGGASGSGGGGGGAVAAAGGAPRCGKKADAQGVTREEAKLAGDAFMRHGRDLNAVQKALGWKRSRVVEHYYCVWKFSPAYQVWKATRHKAGLPGVSKGAGTGGAESGIHSAAAGGLTGSGILNASSDGMRWRGSRLRTLKAPSSQ